MSIFSPPKRFVYMDPFFYNRFRVESVRAEWWDYTWEGTYFVTVRVAEGAMPMSTIEGQSPANAKSTLSTHGRTAEQYWLEIPSRFPFAELDEYIFMPDHLHGIVNIHPKPIPPSESTQEKALKVSGGVCGTSNPMNQDGLAKIIRWFKGRTSFELRKMDTSFEWQPRYYDRIIRGPEELDSVRNYIRNNPMKWWLDPTKKNE